MLRTPQPAGPSALDSSLPGISSEGGSMKRVLLAASIAALAMTATAGAGPLAPPTKSPGKLIVGFDVPAPGFWNGHATGTTIKNPTGFEAALSQAIAKKLGISKVQYLRAPFGGLVSPAPKKYDFAFEEVTITAQRAKVVSFSGPYGGVVGQIVTNEFYGGVMEKGSKLKPFLDRAIKALKANGTIKRLVKK